MKIKAVKTIVFSPCGGTLRVAEAISQGLPLESDLCSLTRPGERPETITFGSDDLAIIAFPVYGGYLPPAISAELFDKLTGNSTPAVLAAVYGNREFEGALLQMAELAEKRGFRPIGAAAAVAEHSINPEVAAGRPDEEDRGLLGDFGRRIFERLSAQSDLDAFDFQAPGAYPPERPSGPKRKPSADPDICILCGECVEACPVSAIPQDDPLQTEDHCICCMACVKVCPVEARDLRDPKISELKAWLKSVTKERKEPMFFY